VTGSASVANPVAVAFTVYLPACFGELRVTFTGGWIRNEFVEFAFGGTGTDVGVTVSPPVESPLMLNVIVCDCGPFSVSEQSEVVAQNSAIMGSTAAPTVRVVWIGFPFVSSSWISGWTTFTCSGCVCCHTRFPVEALALMVAGAAAVSPVPATVNELPEAPAGIATGVGTATSPASGVVKVKVKPPGGAAVLSCRLTKSRCRPFATVSVCLEFRVKAGAGPTEKLRATGRMPVAEAPGEAVTKSELPVCVPLMVNGCELNWPAGTMTDVGLVVAAPEVPLTIKLKVRSADGTASDSTSVRVTQVAPSGTALFVTVLFGFPKLAVIVSTWRVVLVPVKLVDVLVFWSLAEMLLFLSVVLRPLAVANTEVWPAGMKTSLVTVPVDGFSVLSSTVAPPGGAGSDSVTVNWTLLFRPTTTFGGKTI